MLIERRDRDVVIHAGGRVDADVVLPGSKSLTQRYLVCAGLADGASTLHGPLAADDSRVLIENLRRLGVSIEEDPSKNAFVVRGTGGHPRVDEVELNAGAAGTAMRFLTAQACLGQGRARIDGSPRMRQRPIGALVDGLTQLGARIEYEDENGFPPLIVAANGLSGGAAEFETPPSSQYISALLMVAPYASQDVMIRVNGSLSSRPYVAMTLAVMRTMGVETLASEDQTRFIVPAGQRYHSGDYAIEPDASAATYFYAAAAITGGRVRVAGLGRGSEQGDARFVDVLARMGCRIEMGEAETVVFGPAAGGLRGVDVDLNDMPDTAQTLAVMAMFAEGPTRIRNVANLRIKETDRIAALAAELARLGAKVDVHADGLTIFPSSQLAPAAIHTYDDHRMAMSYAIAGLRLDGLVIRDAGCVSKSFPAFFECLAGIVRKTV